MNSYSIIDLVEVRHVALEELSEELKLPVSCKYVQRGCEFSSHESEVQKHEQDCEFRSIQCPVQTVLNCYTDKL